MKRCRFLEMAGVAAALSIAAAGPASAHAHLRSASPAADATVTTAPHELDLHFSEGLNIAFSGVRITGPDHKSVAVGKRRLKPSDDRTLVIPLAEPLKGGTYSVTWHALSKDGHKTKGGYHFTVRLK